MISPDKTDALPSVPESVGVSTSSPSMISPIMFQGSYTDPSVIRSLLAISHRCASIQTGSTIAYDSVAALIAPSFRHPRAPYTTPAWVPRSDRCVAGGAVSAFIFFAAGHRLKAELPAPALLQKTRQELCRVEPAVHCGNGFGGPSATTLLPVASLGPGGSPVGLGDDVKVVLGRGRTVFRPTPAGGAPRCSFSRRRMWSPIVGSSRT